MEANDPRLCSVAVLGVNSIRNFGFCCSSIGLGIVILIQLN
jgi:hypothetical protein